jgi:hypothetical protein
LQNKSFVIKHISGQSNKVVYALSGANLILHEFQLNVLGFDYLKEMCKDVVDFKDAYAACENPVSRNIVPWLDYMIQEGLLFKGDKLCIPKCSMRENLLKEKHSGGLSGHFGQDKTFAQLSAFYLFSSMQYDVKIFVERSRVCHHAKGMS